MNLMDLIQSESFLSPINISLKVGIAATILSLIIALILHFVLFESTFPGKSIIETIIMLPMVLPPTVVGFILLLSFGKTSILGQMIESIFHAPIIFTIYAAILASTMVATPLMYQSIKIGIENISKDTMNAAKVDGASQFKMYQAIIIPLAKSSILTGILLAFARAIGEFGATLIFAGNIPGITETMPTAIYVAIENNDMQLAFLFVAIMIALSFIMMLIIQKMKKD